MANTEYAPSRPVRTAILLLFLLSLAATARAYPPEHVKVYFWVESVANQTYRANILIQSLTDVYIDPWALDFTPSDPIDRIEGAAWTRSGRLYTVEGLGWNAVIRPGGAVWFTLEGPYDGQVDPPSTCSFNGVRCAFEVPEPPPPPEERVALFYWVESTAASTYRANMLIENRGNDPIRGWTLQFSTRSPVTRLLEAEWNGNGTRVTVNGRGWTSVIQPRESVWFTFEGRHLGAVAQPTDCVFNGSACRFRILSDGPDTPADPAAVRVNFRFTSVWHNGHAAQVSIVNRSRRTIRAWQLSFFYPASITTLWNGYLSREARRYTVRNASWNREIAPGDSAYFGFLGVHTGPLPVPTECVLNGNACTFSVTFPDQPDPVDPAARIDAAFEISSIWEGGYVAWIRLTNRSNRTLIGWQLAFRLNATISSLWNGFLSRRDGLYVVRDAGWNRQIAPGATVSFGFQGSYRGRPPEPTDCIINRTSCTFNASQHREATAVEPSDTEYPTRTFTLHEPYPNPAGRQITASFETTAGQNARLELVDVLGRRVETLFDGYAAPGVLYRYTIDTAALADGVYLLALQNEEGSRLTRTLIRRR